MSGVIDWLDEHLMGVIVGFCVLLVAGLIVGAFVADRAEGNAKADCVASGGSWIVDHYRTTYVKSGNVYMPIESAVHRCDGGNS